MRSKVENLIDYLIVIMFVLSSKTVFFGLLYARQTYLVMFVLLIGVLLVRKKSFQTIKSNFMLTASVIFLMIVQMLMNIDSLNPAYINTAIVSYSPFVFSLILCMFMGKASYSSKYTDIMSVIAVYSIICFIIACFFPAVAWAISTRTAFNNAVYNISPLYTWGWSSHIFARNSGPFWEPGAYQGFLVLAILCLLFDRNNSVKMRKTKLLLFFGTILTTASTTGYILLIVILVFYNKKIESLFIQSGKKKHKNLYKAATLIIVAGVLGYILVSGNIGDKFSENSVSGLIRRRDLSTSFILVFDKPLLGYGFTSARILREMEIGVTNNSVGLASLLYTCGIPFGILYLYFLNRGIRDFFMPESRLEYFILLFIFLILHSTEGIWWLPAYVVLLYKHTDKKEKTRFNNELLQ